MDDAPVEKLRRWELSGGTWHVLRRSGTHAVAELAPAPVSPWSACRPATASSWTT